jgi:hypothetical protein
MDSALHPATAMTNTLIHHRSLAASARRWSARRLALAVMAYCSVVSGSVAAAAALVNADVPVEVFMTVF